jgi:hypothetical protein
MKTAHSIILVLSALLFSACSAGQTGSNSAVKPTSAANLNKAASPVNGSANSTKPTDAPADSKPPEPAKLIGTYESREVHEQGVVTLISQLKTVWTFSADGTYERVSRVKGKPYHADSGTFRIEPPDKLVLSIQVTGLKTKREIQNPPLSKTHIFSLSPDGDELKMTSAKGAVAIFQRIAKPKPL